MVILAYAIFTLILSLYLKTILHGDMRLYARRPLALTILGVIIVHAVQPAFQYLVSYQRYQDTYPDNTHYLSILAVWFYLAPCVLMYKAVEKKQLKLPPNYKVDISQMLSVSGWMWISLVLALPTGLAAVEIWKNIAAIGAADYMSDRNNLSAGLGFLTLLSYSTYVPFLAYMVRHLRTGKSISEWWATGMIMFLVNSIFFNYTGNRNSIFITIACTILCIIFLKSGRPVRAKAWYIVFAFIVMWIFALLGNMRTEVVMGNSRNVSSTELIIEGTNGSFGNHENILWLIEHGDTHPLFLGQTFMAGFLNVVPRSIWPNKPLGGGANLKNMIRPGSYVLGEEGASSLTTGMVTETLMNFGWIGLPLVGIIHGWLLGLIAGALNRCRGVLDVVIWIIIAFSLGFTFVYQEFLGFFSRVMFTVFPAWVLFVNYEKKKL